MTEIGIPACDKVRKGNLAIIPIDLLNFFFLLFIALNVVKQLKGKVGTRTVSVRKKSLRSRKIK